MRLLALLLILSSPAVADDRTVLLSETGENELVDESGGLFFRSTIGGFQISSGEESLSGTHIGTEVMTRLSDNFAFGPGVSQGYTKSVGLSTYYTAYEMNATYSLIGKLKRGTVYKAARGQVYYAGKSKKGFKLNLNGGARQYFLNLRTGALYFSGIMAGTDVSMGLIPGFEFTAGTNIEYLSSGYRRLIVNKLYIGVSLDLD